MKNKGLIIGLFAFLLLVIIALLVVCLVLVLKKESPKEKSSPAEETNYTELLNQAFIDEGYKEYDYGFRKSIEENTGGECGTQEFYIYITDEHVFRHAIVKKVYNGCASFWINYYVLTDIADVGITTTTTYGQVLSTEHYEYDFNSGTKNCTDCSYLTGIKNDFLSIINKYDIDIDKIK